MLGDDFGKWCRRRVWEICSGGQVINEPVFRERIWEMRRWRIWEMFFSWFFGIDEVVVFMVDKMFIRWGRWEIPGFYQKKQVSNKRKKRGRRRDDKRFFPLRFLCFICIIKDWNYDTGQQLQLLYDYAIFFSYFFKIFFFNTGIRIGSTKSLSNPAHHENRIKLFLLHGAPPEGFVSLSLGIHI